MKPRLIASLLLIVVMLFVTTSAAAQSNYSFSLDREVVQVFWNSDGSLALDYTFTFSNDSSGHLIDFVDMGMPNGNFDLGSVSADVDGQTVDVSSSDYQGSGSGFAVVWVQKPSHPEANGTVHVSVGMITGVLYKDTGNPNTDASADFAPLYFGSQFVHGNTDLTVVFHLPPGVLAEEPRYHYHPGWLALQ